MRIKRARGFLSERNPVKFTVQLRGRMVTRKEIAKEKLTKILQELSDVAVVDKEPWYEKRRIMMVVRPK